MKKAARYLVKGTVQGVFFRQFVDQIADQYKMKGFVRNLDEGDVEVVVEGEGENLDRFEKALHVGPEHSNIRKIDKEERKWEGEFKEFKIIRF